MIEKAKTFDFDQKTHPNNFEKQIAIHEGEINQADWGSIPENEKPEFLAKAQELE